MSRQLLFKKLRKIASKELHQSAGLRSEQAQETQFSRREFLIQSGIVATSLSSNVSFAKLLKPKASTPNTIIVGAGIAGLVAAHRLIARGTQVKIYEADHRLGGRILTQKNFNSEGMFCELGGELIDSSQRSILGLCEELKVPIEDFTESDLGFSKVYYSQGKIRSEAEVQLAAKPLLKIMMEDLKWLYVNGRFQTPTYRSKVSPQVAALDKMSLVEYLQSKKDRVESWLLDLVQEAYESEFGVTAGLQSALNLLVLFDLNPEQSFKMYGDSDESKRVVGGNSHLIAALERKVHSKASIELGHRLVKIAEKGSALEFTFVTSGKTKTVKAERAILAVPFSVLREVEGIKELNLNPAKKRSIAELGYGTDSKLIMGFTEKFWRKQNGEVPPSCGTMFGDFPTQCFWETSRLQKGNHGILTALFGGEKGLNPNPNILETTLGDLEKIYPGSSKLFDGKKSFVPWPKLPFAKGSYSTPTVGQYTSVMGVAGEDELNGRLLFAGEHCSVQKQGYMDGAVESGNKVAELFFEGRARVVSGR